MGSASPRRELRRARTVWAKKEGEAGTRVMRKAADQGQRGGQAMDVGRDEDGTGGCGDSCLCLDHVGGSPRTGMIRRRLDVSIKCFGCACKCRMRQTLCLSGNGCCSANIEAVEGRCHWRGSRVCERVGIQSNAIDMTLRGTDRRSRQTGALLACWRELARGCLHWGAVTLMLAMCSALPMAAAPGGSAGPLRVELGPLGFQTLYPEFLLAGSSMLTVWTSWDKDHLLITFNVRRLMKREPNDPVDDLDRTVGAFLVELPSGKVLARTEWRLHDHGAYLWNLGHGRFMLRVRDRLTMIAPMASTDPNQAFSRVSDAAGGSGTLWW